MQKYVDDENLMPKERLQQADQKDAKINCKFQQQYYKNVNAGKICVWHGLFIRKLSTECHTVG